MQKEWSILLFGFQTTVQIFIKIATICEVTDRRTYVSDFIICLMLCYMIDNWDMKIGTHN